MTKEEKEALARQKEYENFRGPIDPPKKESIREQQNALDNAYISSFKNDRYNLAYTDDTKATPMEGEWADFGNSIHDPDDIMNPIQGQGELNEIRAADQGFFEKVGLGAAKMYTTAGSTFLDNTVGFLWGGISAIANKDASRIWDNDFTNWMQDFNEWCEDKMPHYSSKYEGWGADFWGNFIGKDILQNLGFQIGTGLSMILPGVGEAAVGKTGLSLTKNLAKFTTQKTAKAISAATKDVITGTYAAIGESTIEALQNKRDFVKYQTQVNEDNFRQQNQMLDSKWAKFVLQNYGGDEKKATRSQEYLDYVNKKNNLLEQKRNKDRFIQQEADKVGDMTFLANMAIVGGSNFLTFGKAVSGGMGLFKRTNTITDIVDRETGEVLKKNVSKKTAKDVIQKGKYAVKDKETGEKILRNAMTQERGKTKSPILNTIKDMFSEGFEEMNQSVASEWFSGAAEEDMLNYDALTRDGMAYDEVLKNINQSWLNYGNMAKALNKVYTDPSQWRQFFSGMIGVGFSPHFQKGSDGKVHFKLNNIGEQNAEINAYNSANALIAEDINRILNSEESQNYINGLVRHKALDSAKASSVALDSKMDFNDADFAQFISNISMLSDAGKLDLYKAQLESLKTMSDEELEDYCTKLCNDVNGKKVGEFVDTNGNYIGNSDSARYEIRKKINNRVDRLLKDMNTYQKSINDIDNETGGVLNRKDLAVFAWEKANVVNKYTRAKSILASEASANNLKAAKEKMSLTVKNMTSQLDVVKNTLDKEKERIQKANSLNAAAESTKKIDKSDFQKELEDGIDTLTSNINIATEISQLIADLEIMQTELGDNASEMDAVKDLFNKYKDLRESMPETAKAIGLTDEKGMSLEYLMKSGQLGKLLKSEDNEIDSEWSDAAILYGKGEIIGESLKDLIKNPERYTTGRAEMEQRILENENKETIKKIEDEIKKMLDDGSANALNIEEKSKEVVDNMMNNNDEKRAGMRLLKNAVSRLNNTPFEALRKIAIRNVFESKKYKHHKDFRRFVNYVYVRIASANASDEAKIASQKFFNDFISDKKTVDECLKDKFYPDDIDVSDLYKDNYTPESYANAELVQNESYQLLKNAFRAFAMDYYSPKLNIDKYDLSNIDKSARSIRNKEQQDIIDEKMAKIESKLKDYINNFADGSIISNDDQNKVAEHIENTVEAEFNPENFNEELRDGIESAKIELKVKLLKYFSKNINDRITKFYENSEKKEEGKKTNREKLADAKKEIDKTVNSINKKSHNVEVNVFNTAFDKISKPDGSMEIRDYKEGYYVENGNVMRGNLVPCNVTFNGSNTSEKHYAVFTKDDNGVKINIISDSGEIIGFRHVREFKNNGKGNLNINGVQRANGANLNDIERIEFLEKKNDILNDQQNRMQKAREQASVEVLEANGTMDENGKVNPSENLHNSAVTVNAIMDDNITQSKKDIEDIRESAKLPEYHRFDSEYMVIYDYENDEIYKAKLPATGNRIIVRTINGKEQQIKFSDKELYDKGFGGILASNFGNTVDILYSSEEEWTGKKSEPKTQKKEETKKETPKVNVVNESNETDDFDYTTIFNLNDIDGTKVEVETISKPWKKDPSKKNRSINIYLKGEKDKGYYQLVKDHEDGFYSVHFKTNNGQHTKTDVKPSTKEERAILYQQLINAIPEGGKVSTWGEISKGGIIALNKVGKNMKNVGMRTISLDDEAHTPVEIPIFEKTPVQEQPAKPVETPKQKAKKQAKQKAKNTASELSKQLEKLAEMEQKLEDAVKNNPDSDYADTLHSVRTFKNYVQLVRDNYEEMGRPEKVVIDANAIWSINNKLTENLKAIFGNDNVLVLSDEEIENDLNQRNGNIQFARYNKRELTNFDLSNDEIDAIQDYIKSLPKGIDESKGLWFINNGVAYKFNTSRKFFFENIVPPGHGFAIEKKRDISKLSDEEINEIKKVTNEPKEDIDKMLALYGYESGSNNGDNVDSENGVTSKTNDQLDIETSQGEARRGQSDRDSGYDNREEYIKTGFDGTNGPRYMKKSDLKISKQNGEIFGYTADGKIVLNKDRIRLDTPVHEYTHLWDQAVQRINPEFWNQGKELMKQSAEWQKVINDKAYESIKDDEDKVASEVHSRLAGYIAAGKSVELYAKDRTKDKRNWFKRLIDWFMKFKDFTLKNIFNMSKADCKQVTLEQFLNAPVADFFMQTDPRKIGKEEIVVQEEKNDNNTHITTNNKTDKSFSQTEIEFALDILNDISYNDLVEKYKDTHLTKQRIVSGKYDVSDEAEFVLGKMLNRINPSFKAKQVKQATGVSMYGGDMKLIILEDENGKEYGSPQNAFWGFNRGLAKDYFKRFGLKDLQDLKTRIENINITEPVTTEEPAPSEQVSDEQTIEEPVSEPEATTDTTDVYPIADTIENKTKELDEQIPALPLNVENQEEREVFATIDSINEHNDPPVPLDTYRPAISRFPIGKDNDTRPSYVVLGKGFEYIWNMYNALGAWDYVSQGKLSKDDDVYIGYGKVGKNGKTVYEDVVFFVKDGDEYQMIGTLVNKNAPESANKLRNDIKRRYDSGKQDMEKITVMAQKASGNFQSGKEFEFHLVKNGDKFLTTKPSKILNGRMQFTDTEYRSLKDVETPDGSKDFNIGFFTPDGLRDNMTTTDENKAKQFRSASSERSGHCVLILNKPDGDYQLVPLRLAKFSEINKPNNQVANDFRSIVSDLFDIYKSNKSAVMKNHEIVDSLANGGIIARMSNLVHTGEFSLFANTNNTITVSVNGKKYKNQRFDSVEKMQDFFEDIMKDCLICINKNTLNNPETLSKYVESDVFSTNLKTTEFANPFYTLMPIDSNGKELDVVNDIQDDNYLEENDITTVLTKFGDRTYAVVDKFGNVKIGVKQFDEFNTSEANRLYSPEQRMRMISYALLKNGMQSNPNDSLFDDYHIDDDENETTLLAHKTMYGDTIFYEVENFTEISPDRVSYYDGEGNLIKLSKPEETETVDNDDSDVENYEDDDYLEVDLDDEDDVIEVDDEEDIVLNEEDLEDEEIDNEDDDISEDSIEVDNESEDKFQADVNTLMDKDLANGLWKVYEEFKDNWINCPSRFADSLFKLEFKNIREDFRDTGGDRLVDVIDNLLERYDFDVIYDYVKLFMDSNPKTLEDGFKLVSEEAVRKILKNNLLNKEDDPSKLANKKNDECNFKI